MSEKPPWRKAIEDYERAVGAPIEEFIKSDQFADLAANAAKQQGKMPPGLGGASTTQWLHSMNLPAASDIDELRAEIQALRDDVRALAEALAPPREAPEPASKGKAKPAPRPQSKAKAKPAPKPKPKAPKPA